MSSATAGELTRQFIKRYLPDAPPKKLSETLEASFGPHDLLNVYSEYKFTFTCKQTQACLSDYLALIDPVIEAVNNPPPRKNRRGSPIIYHPKMRYLYSLRHYSASELLIGYFNRTIKDEDFPDLLEYIVKEDAVGQLEHLLEGIDPENEAPAMDCRKRIVSVLEIVKDLTEQYHQNNY